MKRNIGQAELLTLPMVEVEALKESFKAWLSDNRDQLTIDARFYSADMLDFLIRIIEDGERGQDGDTRPLAYLNEVITVLTSDTHEAINWFNS